MILRNFILKQAERISKMGTVGDKISMLNLSTNSPIKQKIAPRTLDKVKEFKILPKKFSKENINSYDTSENQTPIYNDKQTFTMPTTDMDENEKGFRASE